MNPIPLFCTAFQNDCLIASGELAEVALKAKEALDQNREATILIFEDASARVIEVDFGGTLADVRKRLEVVEGSNQKPRGPGRPRLGVVAREVTLLPRHWEWLTAQPGGASVALRKLVDAARRDSAETQTARHAQEAAYRFMAAMAGNQPGYEEALRALFAGKKAGFDAHMQSWPADVRSYAQELAAPVFANP